MTITDAERHRLHIRFDQVLGEEDAAVLISHLPPSGWSDVVRTRDLDELERRLEGRFARIDDSFARIDDKFERVDERFALAEARTEAVIERSLREQMNRYFVFTGTMMTLLIAAQEVVSRALGS